MAKDKVRDGLKFRNTARRQHISAEIQLYCFIKGPVCLSKAYCPVAKDILKLYKFPQWPN